MVVRGGAGFGGRVRVGARRQELLCHREVPLARRDVQRHVAAVRRGVDVGTAREQQHSCVGATSLGGGVQRCRAVVVLRINVRRVAVEQLRQLDQIALLRRLLQQSRHPQPPRSACERLPLVEGHRVDLLEECDHADPLPVGRLDRAAPVQAAIPRVVQGRVALLVLHVDIGAVQYEQLRDGQPAVEGCDVQRGRLDVCLRVHVRAAFEQHPHRLGTRGL